ncbi:MAG TPA: oligoendopeptidase F [Lachnospiraceae bacterium]|nr:oligoendopeptidase F [Lachnospiraceae bacterium]
MEVLKTRNEIRKEDKWNIEALFESDKKWEEEFSDLSEKIKEITIYSGNITSENVCKVLKKRDELSLRMDRLFVYAGLRANEDSSDSLHQSMDDRANMLLSDFSAVTSFIEPEILALGENELKNIDFGIYSHYIEELLRSKEHILSADKEEILSMAMPVTSSASNIFYMLNNADTVFPDAIDSKGEKHTLTHGNFTAFLQSEDRVLRKNAFENVYATYGKNKNTLAAIYTGSIKADIFSSKVRKYPSCLDAALFAYNIPTSVYTSLTEAVNKRLPLLHRYVALRKKLLGVDELHFYDIYVPLIKDVNISVKYDDAVKLVKEAVKPLGEDYCRIFNKGLDEDGWVDKFENKGKRSGAYSWGSYGTHPYISMNFEGNIDSVFTLIHEMGHSMHSYYTWSNQPYIYGDYTIFVAEVASTVNEALLTEYLLATAKDDATRKYIVNYFLEQFRGTIFRQTMFAEFELEVHKRFEKGEALTYEDYCDIYLELNKKYYGENIVPDMQIATEWARIPHFYTAFYVYQYATGFSAAITLSRKILKENGAENYINFLKGGSSKYSIELLKEAGADMTNPDTFNSALDVFEELLSEAESWT